MADSQLILELLNHNYKQIKASQLKCMDSYCEWMSYLFHICTLFAAVVL